MYAGGAAEDRYNEAKLLLNQSKAASREGVTDGSDTALALQAVDLLESILTDDYAQAWSEFLARGSVSDIDSRLGDLLGKYITALNQNTEPPTLAAGSAAGETALPLEMFLNYINDSGGTPDGIYDKLIYNGFVTRFLSSEAANLRLREGGKDVSVYEQASELNDLLETAGGVGLSSDETERATELLSQLLNIYISHVDHYDFGEIVAISQFQLPVKGSDKKLADTRLLLAEALRAAREYDRAIEMLSIVMNLNPRRFDEAEAEIARIRSVRNQYNDLLADLLVELGKDPNDPVDPFQPDKALEIITRMEDLFPEPDEGTKKQIEDNKNRVQLATDRGYRDRIVNLAHDMIEQGDYLGAIQRYQTLTGLSVRPPYSDSDSSFRLQKESFDAFAVSEQISNLFTDRVTELTNQVKPQSDAFISQDTEWAREMREGLNAAAGLFPDDPARVSNDVLAIGADFTVNLPVSSRLDALFSGLASYTQLRLNLADSASEAVSLRRDLPAFLPAGSEYSDSEYLLYLEQFIAGRSLDYPDEGIIGAARRESRQYFDELYAGYSARMDAYATSLDSAFEDGRYGDIGPMESPLDSLSAVLFQLMAYQSGGEAGDPSNPVDYLASLQSEDQSNAADLYLIRERFSSRIHLAALFIEYDGLAGVTFTDSQEALSNYQDGIALFNRAADFSTSYQTELGQTETRVENYSDTGTSLGLDILDEHLRDMELLNGNLVSMGIDYFNQHLTLAQLNAPERLQQAIDKIDQADREFAGVEVKVEGLDTTELRYMTSSSRDLYVAAKDELSTLLNLSLQLSGEVQSIPDYIANSPIIADKLSSYQSIASRSESILGELDGKIARNEDKLATADKILAEARTTGTDFNNLLGRATNNDDLEQLKTYYQDVSDLYDESLSYNWTEEIVAEKNQELNSLAASLSDINTQIARNIFSSKMAAVEAALREVPANYADARDALNDAEDAWNSFNLEPTQTIEDYRVRIDRAISLAGRRDIPPVSDSRYDRITNDLNEAGKYLARAETARASDNESAVLAAIDQAKSFISSVRTQLPSNPQAAFIDLQLQRLSDENAFDAKYDLWVKAYDDYVRGRIAELPQEISVVPEGESKTYGELDDFQSQELLANIEALDKLRSDSRLKALVVIIQVRLGLREDPALVAARNRSTALVAQATSLKDQANLAADVTRRDSLLNQALALLNQAESIYAGIPTLPAVRSEVERLLGKAPTFRLPDEAQHQFDIAGVFVRENKLVEAKDILDRLWVVPEYQNYFDLRKLRERVYNLLGIQLTS